MRSVVGSLGRNSVMLVALVVVTACEQQGFSGLQAEWSRSRTSTEPFSVVTASHERAVVSARGRQVAIEPAEGFCLAEESIETSGRSAFVLIGDCALDAAKAKPVKGSRGELKLPRGIPGFMTVSVSGSSAIPLEGSRDTTLSKLGEFFDTPEGRRLLGRGGDGRRVSVVESRQIGDGLFVLVDDKDTQPVPLLSSRFWRSFVQLNDRLAVVTMSGFRDRPLSEEDMLEHLIAQVKRLNIANRNPINERPTVIADARTKPRIALVEPSADAGGEAQKISDLKPTAVIVSAERTKDPAAPTEPLVEKEKAKAAEAADQLVEPSDADSPDGSAATAYAAVEKSPRPVKKKTIVVAESESTTTVKSQITATRTASDDKVTSEDANSQPRAARVATAPETALDSTPRPRPSKSVTVVLDPSVKTLDSDIAPTSAPSAPRRPKRG